MKTLLLAAGTLICLLRITPSWGADNGGEQRSWKTLREISSDELAQVDLRTETPRNGQYPYLPAEPYPFTPPYTAEEMSYRLMEFT